MLTSENAVSWREAIQLQYLQVFWMDSGVFFVFGYATGCTTDVWMQFFTFVLHPWCPIGKACNWLHLYTFGASRGMNSWNESNAVLCDSNGDGKGELHVYHQYRDTKLTLWLQGVLIKRKHVMRKNSEKIKTQFSFPMYASTIYAENPIKIEHMVPEIIKYKGNGILLLAFIYFKVSEFRLILLDHITHAF